MFYFTNISMLKTVRSLTSIENIFAPSQRVTQSPSDT